jgi:chitinase
LISAWTEDGYNVYGCVKQLFQLKQRNRNVKTLLSIGGWNFRDVFPAAASTESTRAQFASSAVRLLADLGFDGIDIDWEFPSEAEKANNLLLLLQAVRAELDAYSSRVHPENPYHHLLSVGGSAGSNNYNKLPLAEVADTVDFINLMGYDFAGSWSNVTGHQANLFPSTAYPLATPLSISAAVTGYLSAGVPASKIILGMPVYGRAFSSTDGPGKPYHGVGPGHWAEGLWDYKDLPQPGATVFYDATIMATYSYDDNSKEFITYDTPSIVRAKVEWIKKQGLGGSFFYEASGDQTGDASLVGTAFEELGSLEVSENCLEYPESRYDNIRKGPLSARR